MNCMWLTEVDLSCMSVNHYSDSCFGGDVKVFIVISSLILISFGILWAAAELLIELARYS